jgi:hypothetical protein
MQDYLRNNYAIPLILAFIEVLKTFDFLIFFRFMKININNAKKWLNLLYP